MSVPSGIRSLPLRRLQKCCDQACCVGLKNVKRRYVFRGEEMTQHVLGRQEKACDCFIFVIKGTLVVSLVELKSKTLDYSAIMAKFENGIEVVDLLLKHQTTDYRIVPILLAKSFGTKISNNPKARRLSVRIHGKKKSIVYGKCGMQLNDAIDTPRMTN